MKAVQCRTGCITVVVLMLAMLRVAVAGEPARQNTLSREQTLYVPVYSNVFSAPRQVPFSFATILSIRNTDMTNSITVTMADYYDAKGHIVKRYYEKPQTLRPLASTYIYLPEDYSARDVGGNFIVKWNAQKEINPPIVECVSIGMKTGQGISFVSPGKVIEETAK